MIKIIIKQKNHQIQKINVSGHANSDAYGQDLVCAAITAIVSGALNALDFKHKEDVEISVLQNEIIIKNLNDKNHDLQIMLEMLKVQLSTIWTQYKKYIDMKEVH